MVVEWGSVEAAVVVGVVLGVVVVVPSVVVERLGLSGQRPQLANGANQWTHAQDAIGRT